MHRQFNYEEYFKKIKPAGELPTYNRFIFAFLSVHTTWEMNVKSYEAMKGEFHTNKDEIRELLKKNGVGLYNHRAEFISKFTKEYQEDPSWFLKRRNEKWQRYRNRLAENIKGLGLAKTSFAIEMIYPNAAWVTCIDVHIARLLGIRETHITSPTYHKAEDRLISMAKEEGIKPTRFRWEYWDKNQGYKDCRYWSKCLEEEHPNH